MKIVYILDYYPARTETFVECEIRELRKRGHQVTVFGLSTRPEDRALRANCRRFPKGISGFGPLLFHGGVGIGSKWAAQSRVQWLASWLRAHAVERVHVHFAGRSAWFASRACFLAQVPFSVTVHAVDLFCPRSDFLDLVRKAAPLFTISRFNQRWIRAHYGLPSTLFPCGVQPTSRRVDYRRCSVVTIANDREKKGLTSLDVACRALQVPLTVIGKVQKQGAFRNIVVSPGDAVLTELSGHGVFALAAKVATNNDRDGIPVAILEAMSVGLPVVTTAVSGITEVVDSQTGWVSAPGNMGQLLKNLSEACTDISERTRRGKAGMNRVSSRTNQNAVNELLWHWRTQS